MRNVKIVGILNVTPDSFHDGGKFFDANAALRRACELDEAGADIIEVGGEPTGPTSKDVSTDEEVNRTINVIRKIIEWKPKIMISIDTYKSGVARLAVEAGASMINDVTAGRMDPGLLAVAAEKHVPLVLMYAKDAMPRTTAAAQQYDDVVKTVKDFLRGRKGAAMKAGISPANIILDPGLGFYISSDPRYSFEILARLREFEELGSPIFISPSRKSFLAGAEKLKTEDRLPATIAASVIAMQNGASYIRTHDVMETRRALEIAANVRGQEKMA